jgi:nucleoid DNA-binding protein
MNPKRSNKLYREVAEQLDIEETLVETFVEFLYKELRDNLTNLKHPRINMEGLGHFVVKPNVVRKAIPRYTKTLENHDTSTFSAYYNKKNVEIKLEQLLLLERAIAEQEQKKENFKRTKDERSNRDMEE